ncbi:MAG: hypothetical protein JWQ38_1963 [Flavipsychrobacter sp.]|nr:hypothetical protein [Flavipsychrobacter sp.]
MNLSTAAIRSGCLAMLFSVCSFGVFGQDRSTAPSLIPVQLADNGLSAEVQQLEFYKQSNQAAVAKLQQFTDNYTARKITSLPDTTCTITIPVVFHVFHPDGATGVPMTQIDYALNDLNITFAGADADYGTVNSAFTSVKSYTKFRWKKAQIDPKGNPTTGVVYYKDKQSGFGNGTGYDKEIATCAWDNKKYFNIYIMNDLYCDNVTNNSGVCWYPNIAMTDAQTARMVYNYVYFGFGGSSYNNIEFNQTFTHEAGHYMNLIHTFDGGSCSSVGDLVSDTPPTDVAAAGCAVTKCSGLINGENYMDYNNTCLKNFTMGQNTRMEAASMDPARFTLWQYDNLVATGLISPTSTNACVVTNKFFSISKTILDEDVTNDGSIESPPVKIYACGGAQFVKTGATLVAGTDYTLINVPAGLTAAIVTSSDGKSATLTLSGNATTHAASNSITNMLLTFKDAALVGGSVVSVVNYATNFTVNFKDPWAYTCATPGITTTSSSVWNKWEMAGPIPRFYGLWYDASTYYLENYGRAIITSGLTSDNVIFLPSGTSIGPASAWRAGGKQGVLYSSTYTALDGKIGYVGFRMQAGNDYYYGWMKISVSATAGITLLEYQYCNRPNTGVVAGSVCGVPLAIEETTADRQLSIYPNPTSGVIYLENMDKDNTVQVFDVSGRMLLNTEAHDTHLEIDLKAKGLKDSMYIIKVISGNQTTVKRIIFSA